MKWILWGLLAANAAMFAWQMRHYDPAPPPDPLARTVPEPTHVNRLLLLSEVEAEELRPRRLALRAPVAEPPAPGTAPPAGAADSGAPDDPARDDPAGETAAGAARAAPRSSAPPGEVPDEARTAEPADPEPAGDIRAGAPGAPEADSPPADPPGAPAGAPALAAAPARACLSVGPLEDEEIVPVVGEWLTAQGGEPTLRVDERRELARWWVFFPPLPSRAEAIERVERMREEGLSDIYIIPRGDMANAISLGLYSRRDTLERRLGQLGARGYEPSISPRYRTQKASWFDVVFPDADAAVTAEQLSDRFPDLELDVRACAGARVAGGAYDPPPPRRPYAYSGI